MNVFKEISKICKMSFLILRAYCIRVILLREIKHVFIIEIHTCVFQKEQIARPE